MLKNNDPFGTQNKTNSFENIHTLNVCQTKETLLQI